MLKVFLTNPQSKQFKDIVRPILIESGIDFSVKNSVVLTKIKKGDLLFGMGGNSLKLFQGGGDSSKE